MGSQTCEGGNYLTHRNVVHAVLSLLDDLVQPLSRGIGAFLIVNVNGCRS